MLSRFRTFLALALFGMGTLASAATLLLDDGTKYGTSGALIGAKGVSVAGVLCDVEFLDSSCSGIYANCDYTRFAFRDLASANAASAALLAQVFTDSPSGNFDSNSSLAYGCYGTCSVLTAYDTVAHTVPNSDVRLSFASNSNSEALDTVGSLQIYAATFTQQWNQWVYAAWNPTAAAPAPLQESATLPVVSAVPEPETYALMLAGLGLIDAVVKRKSAAAA